MKYFLVFVIFLFCKISNSQPKNEDEIEALKNKINNTIKSRPIEAKSQLLELLTYKNQLHDSVIALTYSQLGVCNIQTANFDEAESSFLEGIKKAKNYPLIKGNILINLGISYRYKANYQKSIEILEAAIHIHDSIKNQKGVAIAYGEIASNYNYMLKTEKSISYLKKALDLMKGKNYEQEHAIKQKLANAYYNNGDYNYAKDLYEDVIVIFKKNKNVNYYYTLTNYADILFYLQDYKQAEPILKEAEDGLLNLQNHEYAYYVNSKLGKLYFQTKKYKQAIKQYQTSYSGLKSINSPRLTQVGAEYIEVLASQSLYLQALDVIKHLETEKNNNKIKLNALDELQLLSHSITVYENTNNYQSALNASKRRYFVRDSMDAVINTEKVKELQEAYKSELQREKNNILQSKNELLSTNLAKQRNALIFSLVLLALLFAVIFILNRERRIKKRYHKLKLETIEQEKIALDKQRTIEKELLTTQKKALKDKEREVAALSLEMADLQNKIKNLIENQINEVDNIKSFGKKLNKVINETNYWDNFKKKFIEVHPDFTSKLKNEFPELTANDLTFCSFMKLNLSNKEIATLLGISHSSVISKKYRLKKKLNIDEKLELEEILQVY